MFFATVLICSNSFAAGGTATCKGVYKGKKIVFKGKMTNVKNMDTAEGEINVNQVNVADFEGRDLKINYIFKTFKVTNNHGALLEGKVTSLSEKKGIISRLYVPGTGIDFRNIKMSCK